MAVSKRKSTAKKAAVKKVPARTAVGKSAKQQTPAKRPAAKKSSAKKSSAKQAPATQSAAKKSSAKQTPTKQSAAKKSSAKRALTKQSAAKQSSAKRALTKQSAAKKSSAKQAPTSRTNRSSARKAQADTAMARTSTNSSVSNELPKPRFNKDGLGYTKDFDLSFVKEMHDALQEERIRLTGQAERLEDEATQLVEEAEMGDVQFDDEGGEGDTMVVERERDLALSAQAREAVAEIDAAIERIEVGTYGYSLLSGSPIPRERLEAIPWSTVLVAEKVGGIGR